MQTIDVESRPVELESSESPAQSCQLFAHEGKVYVRLGDSCFGFNPDLASAYGLTMMLLSYLQDRNFTSDVLETDQIVEALRWALENQSRLTADTSSIHFSTTGL